MSLWAVMRRGAGLARAAAGDLPAWGTYRLGGLTGLGDERVLFGSLCEVRS